MMPGDLITALEAVMRIHRVVGSPCMLEVGRDVHASNSNPHDWACSIKCENSAHMPPQEVAFGPTGVFSLWLSWCCNRFRTVRVRVERQV